tara:strand:+ start:1501 stop:2778 length:1278 start_codon:yes stop_codon:yes gene_type:complete
MALGRIFDDLATKAIEFNLGIVNKVYLNNFDSPKQTEEKTQSSQMIDLRPLKTTLPTIKNKLTARPLFRGISDSITKGDIVLFTQIAKKVYYIGPLNTFNNPNQSYSNFYDSKLENRGLYLRNEVDTSTGRGVEYADKSVKKLQKRKSNLDLYSISYEASRHSDVLLEGRHSNAIRIGSRDIFPLINISNNNNNIEESLSQGSLISMLSNGSLEENFTINSGYRLSTDILGENDNPLFKLNLGNDGEQSEFDYNYGELEDGNETKFNQIIITSDKITFDARSGEGDFTVSSNRNINFGSKQNFTLNNQGYSVINSGNIYLGEPAKTQNQPMVLGEELRKILEIMTKILKNAHALVQGVPVPLVDSTGSPLFSASGLTVEGAEISITDVLAELEERRSTEDDEGNITYGIDGPSFLSHHHFIEENR